MNTERETPETDGCAFEMKNVPIQIGLNGVAFTTAEVTPAWKCRKLERERDEAREQLRNFQKSFEGHVYVKNEDYSAMSQKLKAAVEALERIERWHGEFPDTGVKRHDGSPISYGVEFGSNGERDYMRNMARETLAKISQ